MLERYDVELRGERLQRDWNGRPLARAHSLIHPREELTERVIVEAGTDGNTVRQLALRQALDRGFGRVWVHEVMRAA